MDINQTINDRVVWIKNLLKKTNANGIIYGNSGGKDCTLVGALAKLATDNVLGVIMPCQSKQNLGQDKDDAIKAGNFFGIEQIFVDLSDTKSVLMNDLDPILVKNIKDEKSYSLAKININPRLRMITLYAIAQTKGYLVAGTGNCDERTLGYFTKWGDGACDFNPISDLTVSEVYDCLKALNCPSSIIDKAPSAGLYPGQTDEQELGIKYSDVDKFIKNQPLDQEVKEKIQKAKDKSAHKLKMPLVFPEN